MAKKTNILLIDGKSLTLEDVAKVAYDPTIKVALTTAARKNVIASRNFVLSKMKAKEAIYGFNTGFGPLSDVRISDDKLDELQINIVRSHAVGIGPALSIPETRAAMLLRINSHSSGFSGVSIDLIEAQLALLNNGIHPVIPEQGSVGASGDLAPLAHMSLPLIGEGEVHFNGKVIDAKIALKNAKLKPYKVQAKEGLALINGTQIMTAIGTLVYLKSKRLSEIADLAGAMTVEALKGTASAYDDDICRIRPHKGQREVAAHMRTLLQKSEIMESHKNCGKVQDPYSLRCIPQVHGMTRDVLARAKEVLQTEINSVTDNPLVFADKKKILSGGNFHGEYVGVAMDHLAMCIQELASISEQRIQKLVNPAMSGLPAFLMKDAGLNSGMMIVQYAAASLVSENKVLCHPATVDSIPTSADKEDHVSMGTIAAVKSRRVLSNCWNVLAMEYLCASQGLEFHLPLKPAIKVNAAYKEIRKRVPPIHKDRAFYKDIRAISELMETTLSP